MTTAARIGPAASTTVFLLAALCGRAAMSAAEFDDGVRAAAEAAETSGAERQRLLVAGQVDEANALLLKPFPEAARTAAQAFYLGNALYEIDRPASYALHKRAAELAPDEPMVTWEWAMQQHRAGEYAGALASYRKFSASRPQSASPYALQADCLLHLGQSDEAAAAWAKSEDAADGSIEQMENLVCAVKRDPVPFARRAALLNQATRQKDPQAAMDLVALDAAFPRDWWNVRPQKPFLDHDVPAVLEALKLPDDDPPRRAIDCAHAISTLDDEDDADRIKQSLTAASFVVDAGHTLPPHAGLARLLLHKAVLAKVVSEAELKATFAPLLLKQARTGADPVWWELACMCGPRADDPDAQLKLEREAWKATGDARFAAPVLEVRLSKGDLAWDDAELRAALKQFPEDGPILHVAVQVAKKTDRLSKPLLAQAAMAEFKHFSSFLAFATVVDRPRSGYLRAYLLEIPKLPAAVPLPKN